MEIVKAEYCDHRELKYVEFIALELVVIEKSGSLKDKKKYKFKGKKLFLNISLDPKKVWLLKNLCNALNLSGRHNLKKLAVILIGKKVKARVSSRYDIEFDEYYHIINRFKEVYNCKLFLLGIFCLIIFYYSIL